MTSSPARRAGAEARRDAMRGLAGKRVVVTGGTSGIGAATPQRFRDEGCEVVVLARTPGSGVIPCDVSDRLQVDAAFEQVGDLDVVVNNAGVSVRSPAVDISPDQWEQVLATNLSGAFWVAQAAARRMLLGAGGVILNTASTNALVGYRYYADYNATKAGVVALTKSLALEWAPRIRVNAVCPGYVLTPAVEAPSERVDRLRAGVRPDPYIAALRPGACADRRFDVGLEMGTTTPHPWSHTKGG